ncbi:protein HEG [Polyodon spathula]|uniref:protein HEG n=1 Tax=Polyodon spathula TaxID=7913 RepID=UPI001B7DBD27|nr:protein HEG [Polyodon spathula]
MASSTLIYRAGLFLVVVLGLFKPLRAEAYTNSTDVDRTASSTELSDFTPNVIEGLNGSTDLPSEPGISPITASPSASEVGWGDSISGFSKNKEPLEEASTATGESEQSSTFADLESWESPSQTDSTYISTSFTRAGERTLLSVSMNSTSPYTGVTNSSQPAQTDTTEVEPSERGEGSSSKQSELVVTSTGPASRNSSEGLIDSTTELSQNETSSDSFPNETQSSTDITSVSTPSTTLPFTSSSSENTTSSNNTSEQMDAASTSLSSSTETTSSTSGSSTSESLPPSSSGDSFTNGTQFSSNSSVAPVTDTAVVTEPSPGSLFTGIEDYTEKPLPHTVENSTSPAVTAVPDVQTDTERPLNDSSTELSSSGRTPTNSSSEEPFPTKTDSTAETTDILATTLGGITHRTTISDDTTQLTSTASTKTTHPYLPSTTEESETDGTAPWTTQTTFEPQTTSGATEHLSRTDGARIDSSTSPSVFYTDGTTIVFETSTATPGKTSENNKPTTVTYRTMAPSVTTETLSTTAQRTEKATTMAPVTSSKVLVTSTVTPVSICKQHPCTNSGKCVIVNGGRRCSCPPAWQGDDCSEDVDECLSRLCPADSTCVNTHGSFTCECPLGYTLEEGRRCALARTFLGAFLPNNTNIQITETQEIQRELLHMLNTSLSHFRGYYRSTLTVAREADWLNVSAVNLFSIASNVTSQEVLASVQQYMRNWSPTNEHSDLLHSLDYTAVSLCSLKVPRCDLDTSQCSDAYGIAFCQCKPGYFKYNDNDHSCRACDDGHKLENGTCVSCPFGFGGFNCGNPYKLITVVLAAAGGSLLLILGITLIVICCRKDKNDISKLIFKSGEFQMSPYAEHPKSNRISVQWGRETIEMQENGSTKNLLQMTDIYYSPGPRTHELDRNGLLPYTGLPGSRHSAIIYPGQYNPSFTGDEARRRDYF